MDNFAEMSHPGVKHVMIYHSKQDGARSTPPCFQVYLMAMFTRV